MKCPRCRKNVKEMYRHCPFCGQKMPEKKNPKFGGLNLCLLLIAVVQAAAVGFLAFGLFSGRFAAHYLEKRDYDRAIRLLKRVPPAQSAAHAEDSTRRAAEDLLSRSMNGEISYDDAHDTVARLMDVSDSATESELSRILLDIEKEQYGETVVSRIRTLRETDGSLAAYEKIAAAERSAEWSAYSTRTKTRLIAEKQSLTEALASENAERAHFFNDGDGRGALYYAAQCSVWSDTVFPEINQKCLEYLAGMDTAGQWLDLMSLCRTGYPELENYMEVPGFSYSEYESLRQNVLNNRTNEQTAGLLALINQARAENRLAPLQTDIHLVSIARSLAGYPVVTEQHVNSLKRHQSQPVTAADCYTYVLNSDMLAEDVYAGMQQDRLTKQHFLADHETLLNAAWIDSVGIHMSISSFGKIYWFIIATG
ncbi:MAG: hypothetical protein IJ060_09845 [Oscillospiraceae bacterium]|nr:hypothetical protein [Oscillospiraceae bacterium]